MKSIQFTRVQNYCAYNNKIIIIVIKIVDEKINP